MTGAIVAVVGVLATISGGTSITHKRWVIESSHSVMDIGVNSDGKLLAYAERGSDQVTVMRLSGGKPAPNLHMPEMPRTISFRKDASFLAIACIKGVMIWNYETGSRSFHKMPGKCFVARYSPDGRFLANNFDNSIAIWDSKTGDHVKNMKYHEGMVWDLQFSANGKLLASCSSNGEVRVLDFKNKELVASTTFPYEQVLSINFSRTGDNLLIGTLSKLIVWDYRNSQVVASIPGCMLVYSSCSVDDKTVIAAASLPRSIVGRESLLGIDLQLKKAYVIPLKSGKFDKYVTVVRILPNDELLIAYGIRSGDWVDRPGDGGIEIVQITHKPLKEKKMGDGK